MDALKACLPDEWRPAGIGRETLHQDNRDIRRDQIHWLDASLGAPVADYLARMESLRLAANRSLMLGLFDYEAHFARYRQGTSTSPIATPSPGDPTAGSPRCST